MANAAQQIFTKILLHNKLLDEAGIKRLLDEVPAPEQAIRHMVKTNALSVKTGDQLLGLFRKQLEKHGEIEMEVAPPAAKPASTAAPPAKPSPSGAGAAPASHGAGSHSSPAVVKDENEKVTKAPGSRIIVDLLKKARDLGASDLHVKAGRVPVLRINGGLVEMPDALPMSPQETERELLKLLDSKQQRRFVESNDIDFCYDGGELGRCRSNMLLQLAGIEGIFRLIPHEVPNFTKLGLPEIVQKFTQYKQGIVLITGPKACGKTTTLAAMVDLINRTRAEHIITIEDPIEFVHPCKKAHVNQREVGPHTNTFSAALRAALREAPDVIMVGEMRDLETTSLAITAAETGHLVFATLHTPDAIRTIDRVLDAFPPKEQGQIRSMISESLRGIVSQLLIPSLDGKGQELALEIMVNNLSIGNLIRSEKTFQLRGVIQTGKKLGMCLMDESLVTLAKSKKIHKDEAIARAVERTRVEQDLKDV